MTVSTTTSRNEYVGSGTTGPFPYNFRIFVATDLVVTVTSSATETETTLNYPADYSVSGVGNGSGGSIILAAPLAVGDTLRIRRVRPLRQTTSIRNQGAYHPSAIEDALDHQVMIAQQLQDQIDDVSATGDLLPAPSANRFLAWKSDGSALENRTIDPGLTVSLPAEGRVTPDLTTFLSKNARYNPRDYSTQDIGAGVVDAGAATASAETNAQALAGIVHERGTYRHTANRTYTRIHKFEPGAIAKPDAGINIRYSGLIEAGPYQIWDLSAAGASLTFDKQRVFRAEWFGFKGDGTTDDGATFLAMMASLPDYATVYFSVLLDMVTTVMWKVSARRGIRLVSELPAFADGQGAQISWIGPWATRVTDAGITINLKVLTSAAGKFTAAMVGQRVLIAGAGQGGNDHGSVIEFYDSATQVRIRDAARVTVSGAVATVGGVLVYFESCNDCNLEGFAIRPAPRGTVFGYGGYITSGTNTLTEKGQGVFTAAMASGTRQIVVVGAGPGGADLVTTITGFTSANVVTLAANASTTVSNTTLTRYIVGIASDTLPAWTAVECDLTGINGVTGHECRFELNLFHVPASYPELAMLAFSRGTLNNQEYHHVRYNHFQGGVAFEQYEATHVSPVSTTAASTTVTAANPLFDGWMVGKRIRIPNAGAGGGMLDAKIITLTDSTHVVISVAATGAVGPVRVLIGEGFGTAILNGPSANAKRQIIDTNQILNFKYGIWQQGGSIATQFNSMTSNEVNYQRDGCSEPTICLQDNTEASLRHCVNGNAGAGCNEALTFKSCRFGNAYPIPNGGYFRYGLASTLVVLEGCSFDNPPPEAGSKFHEFTSGANTLDASNTRFSGSRTLAEIGYTTLNSATVFSRNERIISDAPSGASVFTLGRSGGMYATVAESAGTLVALHGYGVATGGTPTVIGVKGEAQNQLGSAGASTLIAVEGSAGGSGAGWGSGHYRAFHAVLPVDSLGISILSAKGLEIESPVLTASVIALVYGVHIKPMKVSGVTAAWALYAEGAADRSKINGRLFQGALASAPTDADLDASNISFYLDEAGNNLKVRVKYADGTTLKTGTIALV